MPEPDVATLTHRLAAAHPPRDRRADGAREPGRTKPGSGRAASACCTWWRRASRSPSGRSATQLLLDPSDLVTLVDILERAGLVERGATPPTAGGTRWRSPRRPARGRPAAGDQPRGQRGAARAAGRGRARAAGGVCPRSHTGHTPTPPGPARPPVGGRSATSAAWSGAWKRRRRRRPRDAARRASGRRVARPDAALSGAPGQPTSALTGRFGDHGVHAEARGPGRCRPARPRSRRRPERPGACTRRTYPGWARSTVTPGPATSAAAGSEPSRRRAGTRSVELHGRQHRGQQPDPAQRDRGEAHHRPPASRAADASMRVQQPDQLLLDQPGVPGRVLGLDQQPDRRSSADDLQQPLQGEHRRLGAVPLLDVRRRTRAGGSGARTPKSSPRRSSRSKSETTPCPEDVRSTVRSCTQTRCPSRVSRTSHSSASAPSSMARR